MRETNLYDVHQIKVFGYKLMKVESVLFHTFITLNNERIMHLSQNKRFTIFKGLSTGFYEFCRDN